MKKIMISVLAIGLSVGAFAQKNVTMVTSIVNSKSTGVIKAEEPKAGECVVKLVAGDVWGDGTGYQMLLDNTAALYGDIIPEQGILLDGDDDGSVYAMFSHKIPTNADGNTSTENIVLDGEVSITIPAGTYDFCVANPDPNAGRIWIASGNYGRRDDFTFEAGKLYTFTVSLNQSSGNDQVNMTSSVGLSDVVNATTSIYPNPTSSVLTINAASVIDNVEIFNVLGQIVYTKNVMLNNAEINVSDLQTGNYLVKVTTKEGVATKKIVVK
jgi:hypothetical protein